MGSAAGGPATDQAAQGSSAEGAPEPQFTAHVNHETDQSDHDESPDLEQESVGEPDAAGSEPDDHEQ